MRRQIRCTTILLPTGTWDRRGPKPQGGVPAGQANPEDPVTGLRNPLFLQHSQGVPKQHCLEARSPPSPKHTRVTGLHRWLHWCLLEGTCAPFCELSGEEASPSGAAISLFQIMSQASSSFKGASCPAQEDAECFLRKQCSPPQGTSNWTVKHIRL